LESISELKANLYPKYVFVKKTHMANLEFVVLGKCVDVLKVERYREDRFLQPLGIP
jgi:hypothetical protein